MPPPEQDHYISPDQLRVGLYIHLDVSWLEHPFSFNSFKIKSEDQIKTLRSLNIQRIRYEPERSDTPPYPHTPAADASASMTTEAAPGTPSEFVTAEPAPEAQAAEPADPVLAAKQENIERLRQMREQVARTEKAFLKAAGIMRNINRNLMTRPQESLAEANGLVDQMVHAFLNSPDVTLQVMGEHCGGEEVYFHALNVSILAMMLAKGMGFDMQDGHQLGLGGLLHDIGLAQIPDRILMKTEPLTHAEQNLRRMHCEYGVEMGQKLGLPPKVLQVIGQHHEYMDGTGYPKGLKGDAIAPMTRVVALVNHYDNLCNPTDIGKALTPHEALSQMFAQSRSKFDTDALQVMIHNLGVYPPGTIVRLSNEALALVSSVNPQKPLRPWVVVYDSQVPKDEAIILDLEHEPDVNISKAIRPAQLPAEVYGYLSPRKRITYYFDAGSPEAPPATSQ